MMLPSGPINDEALLAPNLLRDVLSDDSLLNDLVSLGLNNTHDVWVLALGEVVGWGSKFSNLLAKISRDFAVQTTSQEPQPYKTEVECASEHPFPEANVRVSLLIKVSPNTVVHWEALFSSDSFPEDAVSSLDRGLHERDFCNHFVAKARAGDVIVKHWSQPPHSSWDDVLPKPTNELFVRWLRSTRRNQRDLAIFGERLGLTSGQRKTLEEVGRNFGITRERVRQVTNRLLLHLSHPVRRRLLTPFCVHLRRIFEENGGIMSLEEVTEKVQFASELQGFSLISAIELILFCCGMFNALEYDYESGRGGPDAGSVTWYLKAINPDHIRIARRLASTYVGKEPCRYTFEELATRISAESSVPLEITRASLRTYEMIEQDSCGRLVGADKINSLTIPTMALIVLRERGVPAHFTTITDMINKRFPGRNLKANHVHNYLMSPLFRWVDRGTYGLAEWGLPEIRPKENYAAGKEAIRSALKAIGRPATIREIQERLDTITAENQDFMLLSKPSIILYNNPQIFISLGQGKWGLREWNLPSSTKDTISLACDVLADEETAWLTSQQLYLEMKSRGWSGTMVALQRALDREIAKKQRRLRKEELHGFNIHLYALSSSEWNEQTALERLLSD